MKSLVKTPLIKEIEVHNDHIEIMGARIRITFLNNNLSLSVVKVPHTYGGTSGLYEIAILNDKGGFVSEWFDDEDQSGDDVLGWCTEEKVLHYVNKLSYVIAGK
jgi:hypothetical protein